MPAKKKSSEEQEEFPIRNSVVGPIMRELASRVVILARERKRLVFEGPTGVGKELLARIYAEELGKKLVVINCAQFTPELLSSELFGHQQGAFTGAAKDRVGIIPQIAETKSILLLDEFQEMVKHTQAQLLRVLESREYRRVGKDEPEYLKNGILFLVATSNIESLRQDILFRFDYKLEIPSYRNRLAPQQMKEGNRMETERTGVLELGYSVRIGMGGFHVSCANLDLAEAIEHCLILSSSNRERIEYILEAVLARLQFHPWAGNFRQIRSTIDICVLSAEQDAECPDMINLGHLFGHLRNSRHEIIDSPIPYDSSRKIRIKKGELVKACEEMYKDFDLFSDSGLDGNWLFDNRMTHGEADESYLRVKALENEETEAGAALSGLLSNTNWKNAREEFVPVWLKHNSRRVGEAQKQYLARIGMSKETYRKYKPQDPQ